MQKYGLEIGKEYKTNEVYKSIFGKELPKGGNERKKQIENIDCYLLSEKGSKRGYIKILEFLDKPLEIVKDKRVNNTSHNTDTIIDLETIIMWLVNNQFDEHKSDSILLSKNNALILMGLVHENYKKTRNNIPEVAYDLGIDVNYLNQFFIKNHNQIVKKLERALKKLHSQRCINFSQCFIVCDANTMIHRVATKEESKAILNVEGAALRKLNLDHRGLVYISGKWKQFKRECEGLLNQEGYNNILFYYEGYEIEATKESIKRAVKDLDYNISLLNVNNKILNQCDKSTSKLRLDILNSLDVEISELKNVAFGEPPEFLIELYEDKKKVYKNINQFLITGQVDKEFKEVIDKYE